MKAKPPCKVDGIDCGRRRVGCRRDCKEWQAWAAAHEAERTEIKRKKDENSDVDAFLVDQGKRTRMKNQAQYQARYRGRGK